jgi:hypothetical protein
MAGRSAVIAPGVLFRSLKQRQQRLPVWHLRRAVIESPDPIDRSWSVHLASRLSLDGDPDRQPRIPERRSRGTVFPDRRSHRAIRRRENLDNQLRTTLEVTIRIYIFQPSADTQTTSATRSSYSGEARNANSISTRLLCSATFSSKRRRFRCKKKCLLRGAVHDRRGHGPREAERTYPRS